MKLNDDDTYLGDGLYASGGNKGSGMITLTTERGNGVHYVCLETDVFEALLKYAKQIEWLKSWEWNA